jgi:hypothetical protein
MHIDFDFIHVLIQLLHNAGMSAAKHTFMHFGSMIAKLITGINRFYSREWGPSVINKGLPKYASKKSMSSNCYSRQKQTTMTRPQAIA